MKSDRFGVMAGIVRPILVAVEVCFWRFITLNIHPLSPTTARAVIRVNEIKRPTR